ncbi:Olfactomedin-like protein 2B [Zootermopsis nevadensis]|uniref:Olfactomedin-like protein 2B n=2 Tax=Zootermopsis nevadensis TaxID=136037 RepID=A0A067QIN1_ZOONE|nr:Olfactomedin-like protein 2B [Zootermopsis nevadensis]
MTYGSWMRDSVPPTEADTDKFWFTDENDPYHLHEYHNKTLFRAGAPSFKYRLEYPFKGNTHVIHNGVFYYNERNKPHVRRFELATNDTRMLNVPMVATKGSNYLYSTNYNYMDFSVDENGLWVIYGIPSTNYTAVMKVNTDRNMEVQYMWNISINNHLFGEMFVACGVLYAVDSVTERNSKIRFALDLYKNQLLDVNLPFTNPFRWTTMVGYNHKNKELYTWDRGNQLTYPIRYHEIGYNTSKEDKGEPETSPLVQTGYDVYS